MKREGWFEKLDQNKRDGASGGTDTNFQLHWRIFLWYPKNGSKKITSEKQTAAKHILFEQRCHFFGSKQENEATLHEVYKTKLRNKKCLSREIKYFFTFAQFLNHPRIYRNYGTNSKTI